MRWRLLMLHDTPFVVLETTIGRSTARLVAVAPAFGRRAVGDHDQAFLRSNDTAFGEGDILPPRRSSARLDRFGPLCDEWGRRDHHHAVGVDQMPVVIGVARPET